MAGSPRPKVIGDGVGKGEARRLRKHVDQHQMDALPQIAQVAPGVACLGVQAVLVARRHDLDGRDQLPVPIDVDCSLGIEGERRHGFAIRGERSRTARRGIARRSSPASHGDVGLAVAGLQGEGRHGTDIGPKARRQARLNPVEQLRQPRSSRRFPPGSGFTRQPSNCRCPVATAATNVRRPESLGVAGEAMQAGHSLIGQPAFQKIVEQSSFGKPVDLGGEFPVPGVRGMSRKRLPSCSGGRPQKCDPAKAGMPVPHQQFQTRQGVIRLFREGPCEVEDHQGGVRAEMIDRGGSIPFHRLPPFTRGSCPAAASFELWTATISKATRSFQWAAHCWNSCTSSHSIN